MFWRTTHYCLPIEESKTLKGGEKQTLHFFSPQIIPDFRKSQKTLALGIASKLYANVCAKSHPPPLPRFNQERRITALSEVVSIKVP